MVTIDSAYKILVLPKQSTRRIVPKHNITGVSFSHGTNNSFFCRLWRDYYLPNLCLLFWGICFIISMVIFGTGEEDKKKYEDKEGKEDEFKKAEDDSVFGGLMGFLFIPILAAITFPVAWVAFQYCMSYNVVFYQAQEDIGTSWAATIWKFTRVIRDLILCRKSSRDREVLIQLSLDKRPPISQLLEYVYGAMDDNLCAQAHTINHLINDGLISKGEAPKISLA